MLADLGTWRREVHVGSKKNEAGQGEGEGLGGGDLVGGVVTPPAK